MNMTAEFVPLVDLSGKALELSTEQKAELSPALARVLANLNDPDGVISAFGSFISGE